jgi:hypothetical protein
MHENIRKMMLNIIKDRLNNLAIANDVEDEEVDHDDEDNSKLAKLSKDD